MSRPRAKRWVPASLLAVVVLMSMLIAPNAFGDEPVGTAAEETVTEAEESPAPVEEPVADPTEEPVEESTEEPVEEPVEEPTDEPVEETVEDTSAASDAPERNTTTTSSGADTSSTASPAGTTNDCVGGLNGELHLFEVELDSRVYDAIEDETTFTWRLIYNGTKEDCEDTSYRFSHVGLTPCLAATSGDYDEFDAPSTYKWNNVLATNPNGTGEAMVLVFDGELFATGTAAVDAKQSDATNGQTSVAGPSCADCPNGYTLTTTVTPSGGGSISGAGTNPHAEGTSVDLTATPTDGTWTFDGWSGDGTGDVTRTVNFTGTDCELEVTATFSQAPPPCGQGYTLTTHVTPPEGGSITGAGTNPHTGGTSVVLTAVSSDSTWNFEGWSGDGVNSMTVAGAGATPTRTVEFTGSDCDLEVTATFSQRVVTDCPNGYTLTTVVDPPLIGADAIDGAGTNPHAAGTFVQLTADPPEGWIFLEWSGDGAGDTLRTVHFSGADCDREVTGTFAEVQPLPPITGPDPDPDPKPAPEAPQEPAKRTPVVLAQSLPLTGSDVVAYLWLAILLITVGAGAYGASRRRRRRPSEYPIG